MLFGPLFPNEIVKPLVLGGLHVDGIDDIIDLLLHQMLIFVVLGLLLLYFLLHALLGAD
jgi:hypothetical protein